MAIIIPSSNIYDKQNNNKVKDNYIERVEVQTYQGEVATASQQCGSQTFEFTAESDSIEAKDYWGVKDTTLVTALLSTFDKSKAKIEMGLQYGGTDLFGDYYHLRCSAIQPRYATVPKITVPVRVDKHSYIRESDSSTGKMGITYTIYGNKIRGFARADIEYSDENTGGFTNIRATTGTRYEPLTIEKDIEITPPLQTIQTDKISNTLYISLNSRDTISRVTPIQVYGDYITFPEFQVLSGGIYFIFYATIYDVDWTGTQSSVSGEFEFYEPKRIEINYYGKLYTLNLEEQTLNYPVANATSRKVFSVEANELMQTDTVLHSVVATKQYEFEYLNSAINPNGAWQPNTQYLQNGIVYFTFTYAGYKNEELRGVQNCRGEIRGNVAVHRDYTDDNGVNHSYTEYHSFSVPYNKGDTTVSGSVYVGTFGNPYLVYQWRYMSYLSGAEEYRFSAIETLPTSTCFVDTEKSEAYSQALANDILKAYKNGKETATILCSIADYYDEDNRLVISKSGTTSKMSFHLYDEVIPYVYRGEYADDRPLSVYADGTPKRFTVIGTRIYYDGAVWQELTLQEA